MEELGAVFHRHGDLFTVGAEGEITLSTLHPNGHADRLACRRIPNPREMVGAHCGYTRAVRTELRQFKRAGMNQRWDGFTTRCDEPYSDGPIATGRQEPRSIRAERDGDN